MPLYGSHDIPVIDILFFNTSLNPNTLPPYPILISVVFEVGNWRVLKGNIQNTCICRVSVSVNYTRTK